jgi:hypothetical protein
VLLACTRWAKTPRKPTGCVDSPPNRTPWPWPCSIGSICGQARTRSIWAAARAEPSSCSATESARTGAFRADGADPFIGRHIPDLFRQAGLTNVGVEARAELYPPGHTRRTILLDLVRGTRPKIVQRGITREQELDDLDRAAREYLNDPCALVPSPATFLTWGRKPTT